MAVYFVQDDRSGAIKIGKSIRPEQRYNGLSCGNPGGLTYLGDIEGSYGLETRLQNQFSGDRLNGEWFCLSDELMQFLRKNGIPVRRPEQPDPTSLLYENRHLRERVAVLLRKNMYLERELNRLCEKINDLHQCSVLIQELQCPDE